MMPYINKRPTYPAQAATGMSVANVVQFINSNVEGYVTVDSLIRTMKFQSFQEVQSFIHNNENNFTLRNKDQPLSINDHVWVKTALKLCQTHCRKNMNCNGTCGDLHVCRNYLLKGHSFCPFYNGKKKCVFGHNLNSPHNKQLLQTHNLQNLTSEELHILFRRRTCRSVSTMPQVCLYYNDRRGNRCANKNCKSLHFCIDYLRSMCIGECSRSHVFSTNQNRAVLDLFAIDQNWNEDALRMDLGQVMEHRRVSDNSSHHTGSQYDSDDDHDDSNDETSYDSASACPGKAFTTKKMSRNSESDETDDLCCKQCCKHNKELFQQLLARERSLQTRVENLEGVIKELRVMVSPPQQTRKTRPDRI